MRWRITKQEGTPLCLLVQPDNGRGDLVLCCSSWEAARSFIDQEDDKEHAATAALCSEDADALCRIGWHMFVDRNRRGVYFRLVVRLSDKDRTIVYRWGRAPFEYDCRTISCKDHCAWFCEACERFIDEVELGGGGEVDPKAGVDPRAGADGRAEA